MEFHEYRIRWVGYWCYSCSAFWYLLRDDKSIDAAKNRILTVLRKVKLVSKSEFTKYIVLKVEYNNDSSLFDLEKNQGIENFISSYKKTK